MSETDGGARSVAVRDARAPARRAALACIDNGQPRPLHRRTNTDTPPLRQPAVSRPYTHDAFPATYALTSASYERSTSPFRMASQLHKARVRPRRPGRFRPRLTVRRHTTTLNE